MRQPLHPSCNRLSNFPEQSTLAILELGDSTLLNSLSPALYSTLLPSPDFQKFQGDQGQAHSGGWQQKNNE
jgi:hypothetical protein